MVTCVHPTKPTRTPNYSILQIFAVSQHLRLTHLILQIRKYQHLCGTLSPKKTSSFKPVLFSSTISVDSDNQLTPDPTNSRCAFFIHFCFNHTWWTTGCLRTALIASTSFIRKDTCIIRGVDNALDSQNSKSIKPFSAMALPWISVVSKIQTRT